MNLKVFKISLKAVGVMILTMVTSTVAMANKAPWESARPANMTEAHDKMAASAKKVFDRVGVQGFGENVQTFTKWNGKNGQLAKSPLANMSAAQLKSLFTGRYHIMSFEKQSAKGWIVEYDAGNNTMYRCYVQSGKKVKEETLSRFIDQSEAGLAGMASFAKGENTNTLGWGWPRIANPSTGEVSIWEHKGKWVSYQGFVQKEIPAVVAANCPNMPKSKSVNQAQTEFTYESMAKNGKPVTGFDVSFSQSSKNPLTLGMFYWAYPPE